MTRPSQKADEKRYVESLFHTLCSGADDDIVVKNCDDPEPDILAEGVRLVEFAGVDGIYVEVTEYHPPTRIGEPVPRVYLDSRWHNELLPKFLAVRQANPVLQSVSAEFHFHEGRLLELRNPQPTAEELGRAIEAVLPRLPLGRRVQVCFFAKEIIARIPPLGDMAFLASEDFPLVAKNFNVIYLRFDPEWKWPLWTCPLMDAGWNAPSAGQFGDILRDKEQKARKYDTHGRPLWLLIVAELANDHESHVFPREEGDHHYLSELIAATGFDFHGGPFQQVWLLSEFTQGCVRLYPTGSVVG